MRYKNFLLNYTEGEFEDLGRINPPEELGKNYFRDEFAKVFDEDYLFDEACYVDTDIILQGKNVDKFANRYFKDLKLTESTKEKYRYFLKILTASILANHYRYGFMGYITIQRKKDAYSSSIYNKNLSARTVQGVLDYLLEVGFLKVSREPRKPYTENGKYVGGASARYDYSSIFIEELQHYEIGIENLTYVGNPIRLKAQKGKVEKEVPYITNEEINDMRAEMFEINYFLGKQELYIKPSALKKYCDSQKLKKSKTFDRTAFLEGKFISNYRHNYYERIFSRGDFGKGGRLFSHWILSTPKELRGSMLLNQEPIVELDFGSMNMHIMSSLESISGNSGKDLYQVGTLKGLDRDMIKQFITIAPNVKDTSKAKLLTAQEMISKQIKKYSDAPPLFRKKLDNIVEEVRTVHAILWGKYFKNTKYSKDWGIKFMFYESNIATAIVKACLVKKIPVFPIHDALITNQKYKDRVVRIMEECFNNYFLALDEEPSTPQIKSK